MIKKKQVKLKQSGKRAHLERIVRQQADELKIKNGQLKNGTEKQVRSEKQPKIGLTFPGYMV